MASSDPPPATGSPTSFSFKERFLQKLALSILMVCIIGPFIYWPLSMLILYYNPFTIGRGFLIAYLFYIFVLDRNAHKKPQGITPIRRLRFWKHVADYFPARLVKTCDLDPKEHYLICGHPHGIACFSYVSSFFIEGTGFSTIYPGITLYPSLLNQHFTTPFHREIALWSGFRGNSKEALINILQGPPGSSVFLVPGGAPEVLKSRPGTMDLILLKRKGFIRIALQTGAHLVPVLAFGETDLFDVTVPAPGSLLDRLQASMLSVTKFAFPVLTGAGFWSGSGPLPRALPLNTVVGPPVQVNKWQGSKADPGFAAAVDELHARYCAALRQLWEEHKGKYAVGRRKSMELVE